MKGLWAAALVTLAVTLGHSRPAAAIAACNNNHGIAPRPGTALPKHPQITLFADDDYLSKDDYTATLDGKPVTLKKTTKFVLPFYLTTLEVQSDKTGTLVISTGQPKEEFARYTIKDLKVSADPIKATTRRFTHQIRHSTVFELYDVLAIELPELPMIGATVKLRRDDKAPWQEFEVPINTGDWMDKNKNVIRLGRLGCKSNYTMGLVEQGIDLEVAVTLADGTTRKVVLPSKRVTVPKRAGKAPDPDDDE